jgi:hypothetical protein
MLPTSFVRPCAQCGADLIAPEWSAYLSNGWVRNVWTCEACGYGFEDSVHYSAPHPSDRPVPRVLARGIAQAIH